MIRVSKKLKKRKKANSVKTKNNEQAVSDIVKAALSSELSLLSFHFIFSVEGQENKRLRVRVSILILTLKSITKM